MRNCRGPDAEGLGGWPDAALGHRRLSIYDLSSAGRQPMTLSDGSTSVLLNGAIYNFLELRKALETRDCVFPSGLTVAGRCLERLLRKLAGRRISERVAAGRKRGFNVPARAWMTTRWRDDVADTFANARLAADGWLTAGGLARYRQQLSDAKEVSLQQWYVYVLEHWYRECSKSTVARSADREPVTLPSPVLGV